MAPLAAAEPSIGAGMPLNCPMKDPMGVRLAATITTDFPDWPRLENILLEMVKEFMWIN